MTISIWGYLKQTGKSEVIDHTSSQRSADYLVGEYQLAFGKGWIVWSGKKSDMPKE
jgi:hypothetical protein